MNKELFRDKDDNSLRISKVRNLEGGISFRGFAAKMVLSGTEKYYIKNKVYYVEGGEYIVGNNETISSIHIDDSEEVHGLCLDVSEQVIREVADYHIQKPEAILNFLLTDKFLINKYHVKSTSLGYALNDLRQKIIAGNHQHPINSELFYCIAECIVKDQSLIFNQLKNINFKKQSTNEELFRLVHTAKEYIDENFVSDLNLDSLSTEAMISKYHFIRLFKSVFSYSPWQYLLQKRLLFSKNLIEKGRSITEVAFESGFTDVPSFSKAFKKQFGNSPSTYLLK